MQKKILITLCSMALFFLFGCKSAQIPTGVEFKIDTLKRLGHAGDNWCITWAQDGSQITSMDDGNWLNGEYNYHNHLYRLVGGPNDFERQSVSGYPQFLRSGQGWFGYGICSVDGVFYSMVSRTPGEEWDGPFRGVKLLKSPDNGESWYRVNRNGEERFLAPEDESREEVKKHEMFFLEEFGLTRENIPAFPFSFCSFVQNGQDNKAAKDDFVYIYSPEGAATHQLLLARVARDSIGFRNSWDYFKEWTGEEPQWTSDITQRGAVHVFPGKNEKGEYFGWYSWLPSVVWNEGLGLYIMANGGTYAGHDLTDTDKDYFDAWMHTKTGSLGFWYSKNPYGPWKQFYYTDHWIVDDEKNRIYQPKLSPKWVSDDGRTMVLIWSDAMKNEQGRSHTVNYRWNQMEIVVKTSDDLSS